MSSRLSQVNTSRPLRRGALIGGICLGWWCLAPSLPQPVSAALPESFLNQASTGEGPVFVDQVLKAKSTRRSGFAPYRGSVVTLDGEVFQRSLTTEVGGAKPSDTLSVLTLKIDGKFDRFQATVGRSEDEARTGPAYAFFEVWGDGTCFFRSSPIRSAASMVTVPTGATIRKTPQAINISVRGTKTLQLVTRYASTIDQQAPGVSRANGCVWGNPRLLTATASDSPDSPVTSTAPAPAASAPSATSAAAAPVIPAKRPVRPRPSALSPSVKAPVKASPQISPPVKTAADPLDPRRDSVRMAVLLLASGVGSASADQPQPFQTPRFPLKIALMPLRPARSARGAQTADDRLQKMLEDSLPTARRGKASLFTLADAESAAQLARLLRPSLLSSIVEPAGADIVPLASLSRAKQVEAVLIPTLLPGSGTASRGESRLDLRLFNAQDGTLLAQSTQTISLPRKN